MQGTLSNKIEGKMGVDMRNAIHEYIELTEKEKKELWKSATFVFDTNVLLNLYRYTAKTQDSLLQAIDELKERIWMPRHVAEEFMKNRYKIIAESSRLYELLKADARKFVDGCANRLNLKSQKDTEIIELSKFINEWINKLEKNNPRIMDPVNDRVLDRLISVFDGKVGTGFTPEVIEQIEKEGKERYDKKTPPGYMDQKEKRESSNQYGDLIIWKEILQFSKEDGKDIILIIDDQKEDWWNIINGKTVGPRVELRKEFYRNTANKKFHMYKMEGFLSVYLNNKGKQIDESVIEEIGSISQMREYESIRDRELDTTRDLDNFDIVGRMDLFKRLAYLHRKNERRFKAKMQLQNQMKLHPNNPEALLIELQNVEKSIIRTEKEIMRIEDELRALNEVKRGTRRMIISSDELESIVGS